MKNMRRKVFSILLVLCMITVMMPTVALATEGEQQENVITDYGQITIDAQDDLTSENFNTIFNGAATVSYSDETGKYTITLTQDIIASFYFNLKDTTIVIDANNHSITGSNADRVDFHQAIVLQNWNNGLRVELKGNGKYYAVDADHTIFVGLNTELVIYSGTVYKGTGDSGYTVNTSGGSAVFKLETGSTYYTVKKVSDGSNVYGEEQLTDESKRISYGLDSFVVEQHTGPLNQAKIGNTEYTTLQAAFNAAAVSGDTITLLQNIDSGSEPALKVNAEKEVTLDLNGNNITSAYGNYTIDISPTPGFGNGTRFNAKLTIIGEGTIDNTSNNSTTVRNYGTLVVGEENAANGPTITKSTSGTTKNSAIKTEEGTTLIINSGTIGGDARSIQSWGNTTINGGTFNKAVEAWEWVVENNLYQSTLTINGGDFNGALKTDKDVDDEGNQEEAQITVLGGTFTSDTVKSFATNCIYYNELIYTVASTAPLAPEGKQWTANEDLGIITVYVLSDVAQAPTHEHSWSQEWTKSATHHWHECTVDGCYVTENTGKDGYAEHTPGAAATATTPQTCTVCGYVLNPATGYVDIYIPYVPVAPEDPLKPDRAEANETISTEAAKDAEEYTDIADEIKAVTEEAAAKIAAAKTVEEIQAAEAEAKAEIQKIQLTYDVDETGLSARSKQVTLKSGKKAILVTWYDKAGRDIDFEGYEIFRSTKKNTGYGDEPFFETTREKYYNTAIKTGERYYYRVRGYVTIDSERVYTELSTRAYRTVK